ncbi:Conserved hypothetical protein [Yarrowia lipolytica]|nr:Conserved hypothetical protein [Yarrowia lipolytica]
MIIFWIALLSGSLLFGVYHLMVSKRRYNWSKKWQRASSITAMDEKPAFGVTADPQRKWGTWIPHPFVTPVPAPYPNWSVAHTKPLPYRPFKHNYFVTMGIRSMSWDDWIELDNEWPEFHARKMNRIQERADKLNHTEPCAVPAVEELVDELSRYLTCRYPSLFKFTSPGIMSNLYTGEVFDLRSRPWKEDPMTMCGKWLQDDLAVMIEGEDGLYYLKAGSIMLSGFWRLTDKLNMSLAEIHTSGDVPHFNAKLKTGMERFFQKLGPERAVNRNNYFIQTDNDLAWSHAIGHEDSDTIGWYTAEDAVGVDQLKFRSERQSLRRLPKTGAIIFTIRTYFLPITQIAQEPYCSARLLDGIRHWDKDVSSYKGLQKYGPVLVPYLEAMAKKDEERGNGRDSEKENYPW